MPDDATKPESAEARYWFDGRSLDVLIYRVNRRPPATGETLFGEQPSNILAHLQEVLAPRTVETGRRHKREWHVANFDYDLKNRILKGIIGWQRSGVASSNLWDEKSQQWIVTVVPEEVSAVAPFVFIERGRFLGVLKHGSLDERNVATVFRETLNRGEQEREWPTTDWDVEPVGDSRTFFEWIAATDRILELDLVFKLPNPDAEREFEVLFHRIDAYKARKIREQITARDATVGLDKQAIVEDRITRQYIAAAAAAFGYITGRGVRGGRRVRYDQRQQVARERIETVGPTWEAATDQVQASVEAASRRRQEP